LSHRNLLHRVRTFTFAADISSLDRTLLVSSPSVSVSYRSIFCALFNGGSVHIVPPGRVGLAALIREIRARCITIYHSAQPLVRAIAERLGAGERLDTVRLVHVGGDRVRWTDVDECKRCFSPDVRIHMSLSSTEAGPCIYWFVEDAQRDIAANPPVGRPAPGCMVTIVGDGGQPAADGRAAKSS
jgi:non-ribosomal peptide synthetase component F